MGAGWLNAVELCWISGPGVFAQNLSERVTGYGCRTDLVSGVESYLVSGVGSNLASVAGSKLVSGVGSQQDGSNVALPDSGGARPLPVSIGSGLRVPYSVFRFPCPVFRISKFGHQVSGSKLRVGSFGYKVSGPIS